MYEELSKSVVDYAKTLDDEALIQYYNDIAEALVNDGFMKLLNNTNLQSNLKQIHPSVPSLQSYLTNPRFKSYSNTLNSIYTSYLSYRADKKGNIGAFSQKIRKLDSRLEDVNASLDSKLKSIESKVEKVNDDIDDKLYNSEATIDEKIKVSSETIDKEIKNNKDSLNKIKDIARTISGAKALVAYAEEFDKQAIEHENGAKKWLKFLIWSVVILIIIVGLLLFVQISNLPIIKDWLADDMDSLVSLNITALVIKGAIVFAYIQIPFFFRKNYFAEKHLEQASIHRRNVLRSLHAVYEIVDDEQEKDKIIAVGATIAFSEPESGFITRKEGAGGDDSVETILNFFVKKQ